MICIEMLRNFTIVENNNLDIYLLIITHLTEYEAGPTLFSDCHTSPIRVAGSSVQLVCIGVENTLYF